MKKFERPIAELIDVEIIDIITTSTDDDDEWSSDSDVEWCDESILSANNKTSRGGQTPPRHFPFFATFSAKKQSYLRRLRQKYVC